MWCCLRRVSQKLPSWPIIARRTDVRKRAFSPSFAGLRGAVKPAVATGCFRLRSAEHRILLRDHARRRTGDRRDQWIGIHSNGIHTYPLEWTVAWNGLVSNALGSIAYQYNPTPVEGPPDTRPGKRTNESGGGFTTIPVTPPITRR